MGTIALGVAALALVLGTVFSAPDAAATSRDADAQAPTMEASTPQQSAADTEVDTVAVTVSEDGIDMPETLAEGAATFEVTNNGQQAHGFAVGTDPSAATAARLENPLEAGQSEMLTTALSPGSYVAYCPVAGHDESVEFTVGQ